MAEDVEMMIIGVIQVAVGVALYGNFLQDCERLCVEHGDGRGSRESVARGGIDRTTVSTHTFDVCDRGKGIKIENTDVPSRTRSRNVQVPPVGIRGDVIEPSIAPHKLDL